MLNDEESCKIPFVDLLSHIFDGTACKTGPIYIDAENPEKFLTSEDAKALIGRIISGLKALGLQAGDVVCLCSGNNIFYSSIYLGVIGARGQLVAANTACTRTELNHLFELTKPKFILSDSSMIDRVNSSAHVHGIPPSKVVLLSDCSSSLPVDNTTWIQFTNHNEGQWFVFDAEETARNTSATLMMTSGTTGLPKAAVLSHHAHVAHSVLSDTASAKSYNISRLICLPFSHSFVTGLVHILPLKRGIPIYVMRRFHLETFVKNVHRYAVTEVAVVPPIILSLLTLPQSRFHELSSLRNVYCAGSPLDKTSQARFLGMLCAGAVVSQVWGTTESWWLTTFQWPEMDESGSVGRLLLNTKAKIIGACGSETCEDDCLGEILIKTPCLFSGYLRNFEASEQALFDGWYRTGDIGYCHGKKWYVVDRAKDVFKVRGWQVSPAEIEACILVYPGVADVAVVGLNKGDGRGELPQAFIVKGDEKVTAEEIYDHVRSRLSTYKTLDGGVVFVASIPRNPSGKTLRRLLRTDAAQPGAFHE